VDELEARPTDESPLPFQDLEAPAPLAADPPSSARWLAFLSILVAGLLGGVVGYGVGDLMGGTSTWAAIGGLLGGVTSALGVGIVANLTLRAMNEWQSVTHPEDQAEATGSNRAGRREKRRRDRDWSRR
jgi:hypothetical protein